MRWRQAGKDDFGLNVILNRSPALRSKRQEEEPGGLEPWAVRIEQVKEDEKLLKINERQ